METAGFLKIATAVALMFLAVTSLNMMARTLGTTMVCLVDPRFLNMNRSSIVNASSACSVRVPGNESSSTDLGYTGTYEWTGMEQSNVISAFSWGKLLMLPVSAWASRRLSSRYLVLVGTTSLGFISALFPTAIVSGGWHGAMVSRLFMGASDAFASPSVDALCSQLIPKSVKSTAYAFVTVGYQAAVMIGSPMVAYFCTHNDLGGWSGIFYLNSMVSGFWILCWIVYVCAGRAGAAPAAVEAKLDVREQRGSSSSSITVVGDGLNAHETTTRPEERSRLAKLVKNVSWRNPKHYFGPLYQNVVADPACWGLYPCEFTGTWTVYLYVYYIPQYYRDVLQISLTENGYFTALPFVVKMLIKIFCSMLGDWLKRVSPFHATFLSKIFNTIGFAGSGLCILLTVAIECVSSSTAIKLVCIGYGLYACTTPGFRTSYISINPNWSGVISALSSVFSVIGSLTFPYVVSGVVATGAESEWRTLFAIVFASNLLAAVLYILFGAVETKEERSQYPTLHCLVWKKEITKL